MRQTSIPRVAAVIAVALVVSGCGGAPGGEQPNGRPETEESVSATDTDGATDETDETDETDPTIQDTEETEETEETDETEETEEGEETEETEESEAKNKNGEQPPKSKGKGKGIWFWLSLFSPSSPAPAVDAYRLLQTNQCLELREGLEAGNLPLGQSQRLYNGAASACLAAFHGHTDLWEVAVSVADDDATGDGGCLDQAVSEMLQLLVIEHRKDPSAQFELQIDSADPIEPPCPSITGLAAIAQEAGSTDIRIRGANLDDAELEVSVFPDSVDVALPLQLKKVARDELVISVNLPDGARSACVALGMDSGWYADGKLIQFVDGSAEESPHDNGSEGTADRDASGAAGDKADGSAGGTGGSDTNEEATSGSRGTSPACPPEN
jgi:hypothetical protein